MIKEENSKYIVLARKYRPQIFEDLIGQESLVRTLTNALLCGRIAQGYMLTGVRGVGKTTTARIIAKALNCTTIDQDKNHAISPCGKCQNCIDISNDCHLDVLEIDAASNTGIGNIKEAIIDSVKKTGKIVVVDSSWTHCGVSAEILAIVLETPMLNNISAKRVGVVDMHSPASHALLVDYHPSADGIVNAALELLGKSK